MSPRDLAIWCAEAYSTTPALLTQRSRKGDASQARKLFCYLLHKEGGWPIGQIAALLGRDHSTISQSVQRGAALLTTTEGQAALAYVRKRIAQDSQESGTDTLTTGMG